MPMQFNTAAEEVKKLTSSPTDSQKLELYALFKQATVGDCNTDRPTGLFDLAGKAKWDSWSGVKGKSQDEARSDYVAKVEELKKAYN
uniref:ACB domain-containing protein n=1 Tax=Arion vulgaris TaxID=1028688 RepID=A0A0B6YVD8_9EUPU